MVTTLADMDGNETFEASAVGHAEEVNWEHSSELSRGACLLELSIQQLGLQQLCILQDIAQSVPSA